MDQMESRPRERFGLPEQIPGLKPDDWKLSSRDVDFLRHSISADDAHMRNRVLEIQAKSYQEYPYPCIGNFNFIQTLMSNHPAYPEVVEAGKAGSTVFLDLGCCMGTDVRKLVYDGYPGHRVIGSDLQKRFIDLGYELFEDRDKSQIKFFADDMFAIPLPPAENRSTIDISKSSHLADLQHRVTHVHAGLLFHLFDESTQYDLAMKIGTLLTNDRGAMIFGRHTGLEQEGPQAADIYAQRYNHSPKSWKKLWKDVFTNLKGKDFAEQRVVVSAKIGQEPLIFKDMAFLLMNWSVRIL